MEIICLKKMKELNKEVYIPTDDFYKFALEFSKDFELLSVGTYRSDDEKYEIDYSKVINDIHTSDGILRIGANTGIINISKSRIIKDKITSFGVLFLIIWGNVYFNVKNRIESDDITLRFLASKGFPMKDIFNVFNKTIFKKINNAEDLKRTKIVSEILLDIEKTKENGNN